VGTQSGDTEFRLLIEKGEVKTWNGGLPIRSEMSFILIPAENHTQDRTKETPSALWDRERNSPFNEKGKLNSLAELAHP